MPLFGDDYATLDGNCIRGYVHVVDTAEAHVLDLGYLERRESVYAAFNLGNGRGFSEKEVVDAVQRVTGQRPPTQVAPCRPGDPAVLVASADRARQDLGWGPKYDSLEAIVATAWEWHRRHPSGYPNEMETQR